MEGRDSGRYVNKNLLLSIALLKSLSCSIPRSSRCCSGRVCVGVALRRAKDASRIPHLLGLQSLAKVHQERPSQHQSHRQELIDNQ